MPRAIISPSVLASDFGQLTAECKRMIKGGAEWLHMGMSRSTHLFLRSLICWSLDVMDGCDLFLVLIEHVSHMLTHELHCSDISCRTLPWVRVFTIQDMGMQTTTYLVSTKQVLLSYPVYPRASPGYSWTAI